MKQGASTIAPSSTRASGDTEAEAVIRRFKQYDERQIVENAPHRRDMKKLIALSEQGRRDIEQLLTAEVKQRAGEEMRA